MWAIEDCRHVSQHLEYALIAAGERVVRVAPKLMDASRRGERERGKSDQIDAGAIARAVLREGLERFPAAFLDETAMEIRLLCDHHEALVNERIRLTNRLRWNLVILDPDLEATIPARKPDYPASSNASPGACALSRRPHASHRQRTSQTDLPPRPRSRGDHARAARSRQDPQSTAPRRDRLWPPTAVILIGQTAGAQRFSTDAQFARMAGVASSPVSSGRRDRHRLDRGGNRQLNRALHIIAITRGRRDASRAFLERKEAEGKSRMEALRCLKRLLARHYHRLLSKPPASFDQLTLISVAATSPVIRC